ncbi:hypothetical protein [Actinoplanes sp. NPDC051859]|uniref:hypothetical protein n=1 Tax=Actinoplanes sp. NPDC051859 TaxID=3363909 RepID=UPI0037BB6C3A
MLWSGSSPLTVLRDGMWGFLLLAGVAWLAIAWSVLRLDPADIAGVAGPVVLFAAVTEVLRACAGTRTWWLNAGMAVLFAATAALLISERGASWTTPAALVGWYLMVRGAADIAISMMTRESDRIWGLLTVVGLAELGLGFFAAGAFSRTAETAVAVLGGAAAIRGVADLVASLRLHEASASARAGRILELPAERAIGVAGYSAGMTDFEEAPEQQAARARHRAEPRPSVAGMSDLSGSRPGPANVTHRADFTAPSSNPGRPASFHDEVLRTTADLDAMLALAGVTGAAIPGAAAQAAEAEHIEVPDTAEGAELAGHPAGHAPGNAELAGHAAGHAPGNTGSTAGWTPGGSGPTSGWAPGSTGTTASWAPGVSSPSSGWAPDSTGPTAGWAPENSGWQNPAATAATAPLPGNAASNFGTPANSGNYGAGNTGNFGPASHDTAGDPPVPGNAASGFAAPAPQPEHDPSLPLLDPAARAARPATPGIDETSIITRRLMD